METQSIEGPVDTPFTRLGGEEFVRQLVERFFTEMEKTAPELAALHENDPPGHVSAGARQRFTMFLMGWWGGPQEYFAKRGRPKLRDRHARLTLNSELRDTWLRCMGVALDGTPGLDAEMRKFLDARFFEVADLLRNSPDE